MKNLRWKPVMTVSREEKLARVGRLMWERGVVGKGGYSAKLTLGFWFSRHGLCRFWREYEAFVFSFLGVRIHFARSYGGLFV